MDPELEKRIAEMEKKIDAVYRSSERVRKYFLATLIVGIVTFVLPLIGLAFVIPFYLSTFKSSYQGLL